MQRFPKIREISPTAEKKAQRRTSSSETPHPAVARLLSLDVAELAKLSASSSSSSSFRTALDAIRNPMAIPLFEPPPPSTSTSTSTSTSISTSTSTSASPYFKVPESPKVLIPLREPQQEEEEPQTPSSSTSSSSSSAATVSKTPPPELLLLESSFASLTCSISAPYTIVPTLAKKPLLTPLFWERDFSRSGTVFYRTPSGRLLMSKDDVQRYLAEPFSCRCGIRSGVEYVFDFGFNEGGESFGGDGGEQKKKVEVVKTAPPQAQTSQFLMGVQLSTSSSSSSSSSSSNSASTSTSTSLQSLNKPQPQLHILNIRNQAPEWRALVEANPSLLQWPCYSWTANLGDREYQAMMRHFLNTTAEDSASDFVEMYCILEGLPRKDVPVLPFFDDNFMAWVGQQDWPKLCVRRTTGQIFPRTLTRHQLTHLFASAMLAEEMEEFDEEEKLRKKAEKAKKEKEQMKMKMKWTSKGGGKVEKISAVEAEVMETDGDSEDFDDNDEDDGEVFDYDDDFDDDDDEEENSSDHESFLTV